MGSNNPGRFRREGREAFEPGCDPDDVCPYMSDSFWDRSHYGHWIEGWREAEAAYEPEDDQQEYWVMGTYVDGTEEQIGEIITRPGEMPIELEIDGIIWKPEV